MTDKILAEKQIVLRPYLEIFGLSYLHATILPSDFRALRLYPLLKVGEKRSVLTHGARKHFLLLGIGKEHSDRLTDTPFNRMQTVTTVCDMGRPDIFAGRQQVINPLRDQGAQRYLKRQRIYINVIISAERRMKIDTIVANADTVVEFGDSGLSRSELAIFLPDMLFRNRKQGFDASRLAYVRLFSHPVVGAEHVATQT